MLAEEHAATAEAPAVGPEPFDVVLQHFRFPDKVGPNDFEPRPLQIQAINTLAKLSNAGHWLDTGTGKTFVATAVWLYLLITYRCAAVVIMPPFLIRQWGRWLRSIQPPLRIVEYKGTPAERRAKDLVSADIVLVGYQIFLRERERFARDFPSDRAFCVIADEATYIAQLNTTHSAVYDFAIGHPQMMLSGTPANKPGDAYGLIKFTAPGTYRNKRHFENLHVAERDFFDNPVKWDQIELLNQNLMRNSVRILYGDMFPKSEIPFYNPFEYELEPDHWRLYKKLAEEQILKLPDGGKIDATTVQRLRHALGQIILNHGHFAGEPKKVAAGVALIEEKLHDLGDGKLLVFTDYRLTMRTLLQHFGKIAVGANGQSTQKQKEDAVERFIDDPACRVAFIQFQTGGKGLDGLQHVCHHAMFIEPCQQPRDFHQAVARLHRGGQKNRVMVHIPIAAKTLQIRGFNNLLKNDSLVNRVIRSPVELRREIYGESED